MDGATIARSDFVANVPASQWRPAGTGDYNGDGKTDVLWRGADGATWAWRMDGATILGGDYVGTFAPGVTLQTQASGSSGETKAARR
jgi:hypothetical protein